MNEGLFPGRQSLEAYLISARSAWRLIIKLPVDFFNLL